MKNALRAKGKSANKRGSIDDGDTCESTRTGEGAERRKGRKTRRGEDDEDEDEDGERQGGGEAQAEMRAASESKQLPAR